MDAIKKQEPSKAVSIMARLVKKKQKNRLKNPTAVSRRMIPNSLRNSQATRREFQIPANFHWRRVYLLKGAINFVFIQDGTHFVH
jgi:hypothetical protein